MARSVETALRSATRIVTGFATKRQVLVLLASRDGRVSSVQMVRVATLVEHFYAPRKISGEHIVVALSVRPSVRQSVRPSVRTSHSCPAHNFVI